MSDIKKVRVKLTPEQRAKLRPLKPPAAAPLRGAAKAKAAAKVAAEARIRRVALQGLELQGDSLLEDLLVKLNTTHDELVFLSTNEIEQRLNKYHQQQADELLEGYSCEQLKKLATKLKLTTPLIPASVEMVRSNAVAVLTRRNTAEYLKKLGEHELYVGMLIRDAKKDKENDWKELLRRGGSRDEQQSRKETLTKVGVEELTTIPRLMAVLRCRDDVGVMVFRAIMQIAPSPAAGIVLSQLLYWHDLRGDSLTETRVGRNGLCKQYGELAQETGLTYDQVRTACGRLVQKGLIKQEGTVFSGKRSNNLTPQLKVILAKLGELAEQRRRETETEASTPAAEERERLLQLAAEAGQEE